MEGIIENICNSAIGCNDDECNPTNCYISYIKNLPESAHTYSSLPNDKKTYEEQPVISAIKKTLHNCQNCQKEHSPSCINNITRTSLFAALIKPLLAYLPKDHPKSNFRHHLAAIHLSNPKNIPAVIKERLPFLTQLTSSLEIST